MKITTLFIIVSCCFLTTSAYSQESKDISGKWMLVTQTKTSVQNQNISISIEDDHFKGTYDDVEFDIYVDDNKIQWKISQPASNGAILIEANGVQVNENLYMGLTSAKTNIIQLDKMKWSLERIQ